MKKWMFWGFATALLATIVHLAVVLFAPVFDVGRKMAAFETAAPLNSLFKIDNADQGNSLLVEPSPDIVYAFCRFDLSSGPLLIEAAIPATYWSVSVYSDIGENIYTLNDAQTGGNRLRLVIVAANPAADEDAQPHPEQNTLKYTSPARSGLIIFRGFVPDRSMRDVVKSTVSAAKCNPVRQLQSELR